MATNFNRMTVRESAGKFQVFKMKPVTHVSATGGGYRPVSWVVSRFAAVRFEGTYAECMGFIEQSGAQYMSEHGLPV